MTVLDTHVLVWWVNGSAELSDRAARTIRKAIKAGEPLLVSSITAWEIAMLVRKGRLVLTMDAGEWLAAVAAMEGIRFVPVDNETCMQSVNLPGEFHADPADRMIVALARRHSMSLLTADTRLHAYPHVNAIW